MSQAASSSSPISPSSRQLGQVKMTGAERLAVPQPMPGTQQDDAIPAHVAVHPVVGHVTNDGHLIGENPLASEELELPVNPPLGHIADEQSRALRKRKDLLDRPVAVEELVAGNVRPLEQVALLAASIGFDLRRRGCTVPATDLIVTACAIRARAELLQVDDHFDEIAGVSALACRNPAKSI